MKRKPAAFLLDFTQEILCPQTSFTLYKMKTKEQNVYITKLVLKCWVTGWSQNYEFCNLVLLINNTRNRNAQVTQIYPYAGEMEFHVSHWCIYPSCYMHY